MDKYLAECIAGIFRDARMSSQYRDDLSRAARAAGISPRLLISIESGRERIRDPRIYAKLSKVYGHNLKTLNDLVESERLERIVS